MKAILFCVAGFLCLCGTSSTIASAQQTARPFTITDEIGLTLFVTPGGEKSEVHFSPDGSYFAVWIERGRLGENRVEDSLRFYGSEDVRDFLKLSEVSQPPSPLWIVNRSGKEGEVISDWRWLGDSSGVAFLEGEGVWGDKRLVLADLRKKTIEFLTSNTEAVRTFDIRDQRHYVYTAAGADERKKPEDERQETAIVGGGRSLYQLIFPDSPIIRGFYDRRIRSLWAVVDGKRLDVKVKGVAVIPEGRLVLSPDGQFLVTELKVSEVPASWETLYPPPYASDPHKHIHAGSQNVREYVLIDLHAGSVRELTGAPIENGDWAPAHGSPSWSSDGQAILLPRTFLKSKDKKPSRPCLAVVDLSSDSRSCVEILKGHTESGVEEGYHGIRDPRFVGGDKRRIIATYLTYPHGSFGGTNEYRLNAEDTWRIDSHGTGNAEASEHGFEVTVKQSFNEPPLLVAANEQASRIVWDPNPQLKNFDLAQASVYTWKTKEGLELKAGLFKPSGYKAGQRYPLVIQTHGFVESEFRPSGVFPTAFAAEALASAGMAVLQVQEDDSPRCPEGPCEVSEYEAAVNQLVSEGLVDPERVGIIGFSRTCFYVMETLTTSSLRFRAASITDGVMGGYLEYILLADILASDSNSLIGAPPFGEGLQQWLKRSPGFNLDKINAPLMVVGLGPGSLLYMWQPYAGLRYLQKPVDVIMLNSDEHILTNPAVRMASQGGSVDWFRFWLQDYEDPDPAKVEQYARWRELKKMQEENDAKAKAAKEKPPAVN